MSYTVVIPARYGSTRLPGKPLADLAGKPMIRHVYERACASKASRVVVATDDQRIVRACQGFGAEVVMTSPDHTSGTDRLQEVASFLGLCERIHSPQELFNPNVVKVVFDHQGFAHYFSRAPMPWARDHWHQGEVPVALPASYRAWRHIGIYGYRASLLHQFVRWPAAPTELTESLEQLRALYNGARIHVSEAEVAPPAGVDTPEDLARLSMLMSQENPS